MNNELLNHYKSLDEFDFRLEINLLSELIKNYDYKVEYTSDYSKYNDTINKEAVKQQGRALTFASDRLKYNNIIVEIAISECGHSMKYASDRLKNDRNSILRVVKKCDMQFNMLLTNSELIEKLFQKR